MKNILGKTENLELFNKDGKKIYSFTKNSNGYSCECTYDQNSNELTYKDSDGFSWECNYEQNSNILSQDGILSKLNFSYGKMTKQICNHSYILTSENGHRIIKCLKCNNVQPI